MTEVDPISNVVRLLMEHRASLFSYIYTAVRDFDVAEEVFQEVSVAVCESYESFEPGTNFRAWAREIARRRVSCRVAIDGSISWAAVGQIAQANRGGL